jgi:nitrogen fixation-related uncharacterized protein
MPATAPAEAIVQPLPESEPAASVAPVVDNIPIEEAEAVPERETAPPAMPEARPKVMVSEDISGLSGLDMEVSRSVTAPGERKSETRQQPRPLRSPIQKLWSGFLMSMSSFFRKIAPEEFLPALPPTVLAVIAIVIPIIVVAIATLIYFRSGKTSQYELYYQQAEQLARQASAQINASASRQEWTDVLDNLNLAGKYGDSSQGQALRTQAQTALDELDGIIRLDFDNAFSGGLAASVQVSRMAASNTELFILDAKTGSIFRFFSASQGYELDEDFECGPQYLTPVS